MHRRRNSCGPGELITAGSAVGRRVATVSAWVARRIRSRSASNVAICEIINSLDDRAHETAVPSVGAAAVGRPTDAAAPHESRSSSPTFHFDA